MAARQKLRATAASTPPRSPSRADSTTTRDDRDRIMPHGGLDIASARRLVADRDRGGRRDAEHTHMLAARPIPRRRSSARAAPRRSGDSETRRSTGDLRSAVTRTRDSAARARRASAGDRAERRQHERVFTPPAQSGKMAERESSRVHQGCRSGRGGFTVSRPSPASGAPGEILPQRH